MSCCAAQIQGMHSLVSSLDENCTFNNTGQLAAISNHAGDRFTHLAPAASSLLAAFIAEAVACGRVMASTCEKLHGYLLEFTIHKIYQEIDIYDL